MQATRTPIAATLALVLCACGGGGANTEPADAPPPTAALPTPAAAPLAPATAPVAPAAPVPTLALRDWLAPLTREHGLRVAVDPSIAARPMAQPLPRPPSGDALAAALAGFDVQVGYAARGGGTALASISVLPRGGLAAPAAAPHRAEPAAEAVDPGVFDPAQAMLRVQQDLASADDALRRAAMVRSFELEAPLPAATLTAALQGDASPEVRLYALMALARHPLVAPVQLRQLAQTARHDADAGVRAHAREVEERLDALERGPG